MEFIISIKANKQSINYAKKSISLTLSNLVKFYKFKKEINAKKLLLAANFSVKGDKHFKYRSSTCFSYLFSTHFGLSHGHSVSLRIFKNNKI